MMQTAQLPLTQRQRARGVIAAYPRTVGGQAAARAHAAGIPGGRVTHARNAWTVHGPATRPLISTDGPVPDDPDTLELFIIRARDRRWRAGTKGDTKTVRRMQEVISRAVAKRAIVKAHSPSNAHRSRVS